MTLKERYNRTPDGSMHFTNTMGVAIWIPDSDDVGEFDIIAANWIIDSGYKDFRHHKLNSTSSGRLYFWKNGCRICLDEIVKVY
jgi:hypothetical protein